MLVDRICVPISGLEILLGFLCRWRSNALMICGGSNGVTSSITCRDNLTDS